MATPVKNIKPLQRISYNEKIANNNEWGKQNIQYYKSISGFGRLSTVTTDRDIQLLYDIYNNKLPDTWFNYVTNPINSTKTEFKNFPARIRPYTILRPNIDLFCGEFSKRPFNYQVQNAGEDAYNSFLEAQKVTLKQNLEQHFVNAANEAGVDTGQESQPVELPQEILNKFLSSYKDIRAMMGQDALTIIEEENQIRELFGDLIKDWCIAGEIYTHKDVRHSNIDYERVSPLDIDYDKSLGVKYIEDGEWASRRMYLTVSDIIDRWYDDLKNEDLEGIEGQAALTQNSFRTPLSFLNRFSQPNREERRNKIAVYHTVWKSQTKIGILSYPDPVTGQIQQLEVSEDYPVDKEKGESIEYIWGNQVWEGYEIDGTTYVGIRPIPVQRNEMNNFSKCKLPYNGKRFSDTHSENISILELGIPYQIMHIIYKYRLELTLNKHKGKLALIDKNVIPNKPGWDEEKFLYYAESLGYMFIDRNQIGADKSFNQYSVLDMDLFQHIDQMLKLIATNKQEWDEVLGINNYRKGQTQASDAVGNVQQGVFQSPIMSEVVYTSFEDFLKRELKGLLDYSKFAWVDGKKKVYRSSDERLEILKIDPEDFCESEYDIFVVNSSNENEKLKALRGVAQSIAQNGGSISMVAEIIGADNYAKVSNKIKTLEDMEHKLAEQTEKNKADAEQEKLKITQEFEAIKHDMAVDLQDKKYDRENDLAKVKGEYQIEAASVVKAGEKEGLSGIEDLNALHDRNLDREKHYGEVSLRNRELDIKEKELKDKNIQVNKKVEAERYKADTQLSIAEENRKKHNDKKL